ncbi:MAG: hypothetical protein JWO39_1815, partial [Gemmatimonadetes bacterium]|nr:hypothetical protein [Gemmatimonadota bacterium]
MHSTRSDILVRRGTVADISALAHHRAGMYRDMGVIPSSDEAQLFDATTAYLRSALESGEYLAWLAVTSEAAEQVV